ncbi:UNVERIFIED_CONTAM: hypothetical protein Cloal_1222 [Acetivibrio alkalicellulosi]
MDIFKVIFNNNELFYLIIGSFISFLITFSFFKVSARGASIAYDWENILLIDKENQTLPLEIEIAYKNNSISKLSRTLFYIWNNGNKTIRKDCFVSGEKLRIELDENIQIFSANLLKNTDDINKFTISHYDKNLIHFDFEYLEPKSGVKLEILHDLNHITPHVKGKIIDVKEAKKAKDLINNKFKLLINLFPVIGVYLISWLVSMIVFYIINLIGLKINIPQLQLVLSLASIILYSIIPAVIISVFLKEHKKSKNHPAELDK